MAEDSEGGLTGRVRATEALVHLYVALDYLAAISEATNSGAIARAGRATQQELWAAVALLGGDRDGYLAWDAQRTHAAKGTHPHIQAAPGIVVPTFAHARPESRGAVAHGQPYPSRQVGAGGTIPR